MALEAGTDTFACFCTANFSMPEIGEVFQEVFFVEAKPPEAHKIAAAQAEAVNIIHLKHASLPMIFRKLPTLRQWSQSAVRVAHPTAQCCSLTTTQSCSGSFQLPKRHVNLRGLVLYSEADNCLHVPKGTCYLVLMPIAAVQIKL